jgi:hypothetical protein
MDPLPFLSRFLSSSRCFGAIWVAIEGGPCLGSEVPNPPYMPSFCGLVARGAGARPHCVFPLRRERFGGVDRRFGGLVPFCVLEAERDRVSGRVLGRVHPSRRVLNATSKGVAFPTRPGYTSRSVPEAESASWPNLVP